MQTYSLGAVRIPVLNAVISVEADFSAFLFGVSYANWLKDGTTTKVSSLAVHIGPFLIAVMS